MVRVVITAAQERAIARAKLELFIEPGIRRENVVFGDSQGAVTVYRETSIP